MKTPVIVFPESGDTVSFQGNQVIARYKGNSEPLQLFVFANDHKWYKQAPGVFVEGCWHFDCVCGFELVPEGSAYALRVIAGHLDENVLDEMPEGLCHSEDVLVMRGEGSVSLP